MRSLSTSELLTLWEQGVSQTPLQRSLALITAACPDLTLDRVMQLSIGQRDRLLLTLREQIFGSQLVSVAVCPACGDRLELNFTVDEVRLPATEIPPLIEVHQGEYQVQVRLPNSLDLAAIAQGQTTQQQTVDLPDLRRQLLERCLVGAQRQTEHQNQSDNRESDRRASDKRASAVPITEFPEELVGAIANQLAAADPQADIQLNLKCLACGHCWSAVFEIGGFLWSELQAWAVRLLQEVHGLAAAYGWSEADILAMSAQRRQWYLELIGAV